MTIIRTVTRIPGSNTTQNISAVWNMPPANTLAYTGLGNLQQAIYTAYLYHTPCS